MSDDAQNGTDTAQAATSQAKSQSLEDLLSGLDEDARKVVLGEVTKARTEAKGLRERLKAAEPGLQELETLKQANQSETERWQSFAKQQEDRAAKAEREAMVARVALAKRLPANLAARLQGDDEAALAADADELLSLVPKDTSPRAPRVDLSQGSSAKGGTAATPAQEFAGMLQTLQGR